MPSVRRLRGSLAAVVRSGLRRDAWAPGWLAVPRLLLLVAVAAGYLERRPDDDVVWVAFGLMLVATASEGFLRLLRPRRLAANLPGFSVPRTPFTRFVVPAALAAVGLAVVAGAAALPPSWVGVVAAVEGAITLAALVESLRAYLLRADTARKLREAIDAYAPEYLLYTARRGGQYQLEMWLPHLETLARRHLVLTRDPEAVEALAAVTRAPVVAAPTWRDLDDVVVPSLRAAFYVNSVASNADLVTYRQMTHVYLGHGESDKALSHHPAHAMYDRVFVAGEAAIERYERHGVHIPREKFTVVGSPQSSAVQRATRRIAEVEAPTVLYAPTWQGYNTASSYSSLPHGTHLVEALLRRSGPVVFRPHPFTRTRVSEGGWVAAIEEMLADDARTSGRQHVWGVEESFADSANRADVMVADVSSVVTEFLVSGKPLALYTDGSEDFRVRHPVAHAAYLLDPGLGNLEAVLGELLGDDPLAGERAAVRRRYIGAEGVQPFRDAVLEVLDGEDRRAGATSGSR
jgi:hypothetical protein